MTVEVGSKAEGKVTGITNFGAFVDLGEGQSGMVHISEVADGYVKDIHDVLKVGDTVKVLVLNEKDHKIALSIKQASDRPRPKRHFEKKPQHKPVVENFDDMMSDFMKQSEERMTTIRKNTEGKRGGRGGRRS
ncbi:S1 domain-containing RNA-binding protein [Companilactobacillus keshanensis]|uniref:S1 domain-containing RNA-binding protein n=1 Tax=Companilactobacillus keshanensis TaxID=2486003 RepID=A0ABW4BRD4_9LACO|nr:S1 domain-containing RNA-binding protein [Companilactobacillus keshanensis]